MEIQAPAKINLFLAVNGKRKDGYHDITTLFCRISLYDTVRLEWGKNEHSVTCSDPAVPGGEANLAHHAAVVFSQRLKEKTGTAGTGVAVHIDKNIPVGAGLGGGSSDAATVLAWMNRVSGHPFSTKDLMDMGRLVGADVPFFIFQKPAIGTDVGGTLRAAGKIKPYTVVLVYPGVGVSTATVYKNLNLGLTKCKQKLNCFIFNKEPFQCGKHLCNDLETVTAAMFPEIEMLKQRLIGAGAEGALMSGSGTSVFGLFSDTNRATACFRELVPNRDWRVHLCQLLV